MNFHLMPNYQKIPGTQLVNFSIMTVFIPIMLSTALAINFWSGQAIQHLNVVLNLAFTLLGGLLFDLWTIGTWPMKLGLWW